MSEKPARKPIRGKGSKESAKPSSKSTAITPAADPNARSSSADSTEPDIARAEVVSVDGLPVAWLANTSPDPKTPTPFHEAYQTTIVGLVAAGVPLRSAAASAGLTWGVVTRWIAKGHQGIEPFATFHRKIEEARGSFVAANVDKIVKAAATDWKAAAWLLERRSPQFNPKQKVETTHKGEGVRVELYIPDNGRGR